MLKSHFFLQAILAAISAFVNANSKKYNEYWEVEFIMSILLM